jgi:hypothetical protein
LSYDVMLDEIIRSGRLRFSADVSSIRIQLPGWPIACLSHWERRLHWIAMSSSSSLRKTRGNTSSFRNTDHFGFGRRSGRKRCTTFSRSSSWPSSTRAATGYLGARGGATASHLSGCKTDSQRYHAGISTAPTTAVLNSRFYEISAGGLVMPNLLSIASSGGSGHGTSDRHLRGTVD